ncbi:MAG: exodeoxyribonuclease V subunit beta, partial [Syntrophales bacterium LBB04]|nr:exodeoxyribonuclease V subunit beta [Syntrophales bacterium LBB04]
FTVVKERMEAAEEVLNRYTLTENWRSEPHLIKAVNTLFSNSRFPFVYGKIGFQPASAAGKKEPEIFRIDGKRRPALHVWYMDPENWAGQEGVINKGVALEEIPGLVASEICRLLNLGKEGRARIGKEALRAQHIAVLVRTNKEAQSLKEALSVRNIASVLYSTQNLFDSHEALEMERVLCAVMEPNNESFVKAALVSDMIGMTGDELDGLMREEATWEAWLEKYRRYHDLWRERGFMPMFRSF